MQQSTQLVIEGGDIPFGAYQAIYHKLTKKIEKLYKEHNEAYDVRFDDIKGLHSRLDQLIAQYSVQGKNVEIDHSFYGDQSRSFSSFEKFRSCDNTTSCPSKRLNYALDFLIVLPAQIPQAEDIAQRFKVSVTIFSPRSTQDNEVPPGVIHIFGMNQSIDVMIEYSDYAVALAIQAVTDAWVATLPCRKPSSILKRISRTRWSNKEALVRIICSIPTLFAAWIASGAQEASPNFLFGLIFSTFGIILLTSGLIIWLWDNVANTSGSLMPQTRLFLTNGDDRRHGEEEKSFKKKVILALKLLGISVAVGVNLFSSYIFENIKDIN